jgi:NAD(P)H dehydrogenase (quinone)
MGKGAAMTQSPPPPRHAVILAHPNPRSFNAQVAETYRATVAECGQDAIVRDLYALGFDPVLREAERPGPNLFSALPDVRTELDLIAGVDALVLVYPIWFGAPPAMMKGYIDRVMGYAVSPRSVLDRRGNGLLHGATLLSFTSSATSEPWLAEQGQEVSIRTLFDRYLAHGFGMKASEHVHFGGVVEGLAERFVDQHLYEVAQHARRLCAAIRAEQYAAQAAA